MNIIMIVIVSIVIVIAIVIIVMLIQPLDIIKFQSRIIHYGV